MSSDREKMQLILDTRNGKLVYPPSPIPVKVETAELSVTPFQQLDLNWNPDGTIKTILVTQEDEVYTLHFMWNSDGTVSRIVKR